MTLVADDILTTIEDIEKNVWKVVDVITKCIDAIRSNPSFKDGKEIKNYFSEKMKKKINNSNQIQSIISCYLFEHLRKEGIVDLVAKLMKDLSLPIPNYSAIKNYCKVEICSRQELDRRIFFHNIICPLTFLLSHWYNLLDSYDLNKREETNSTLYDNVSFNLKLSQCFKITGKKNPSAPIGLISLANYTDIACILELAVCTSILPHLERHLLTNVFDRVKYRLPKTMAGRMPHSCYLWGTHVVLSNEGGRNISVNLLNNNKESQERNYKKLEYIKMELMCVILSVSNVLLMDRFRPMLLRRHAPDIYAAIFQVERIEDILQKFILHYGSSVKFDKLKQKNYAINNDLIMKYENIKQVFLPFIKREDSTIKNTFNIKPSLEVDTLTRATSYRTILASSGRNKSLSWIRIRVGILLTNLAITSQIGLRSILHAFVISFSTLTSESMTTAASRLAQVLCTVRSFNEDSKIYYKMLCHQLVQNITSFISKEQEIKHNNDGKDERNVEETAVILTFWAVLEYAPRKAVDEIFHPALTYGVLPFLYDSNDTIIKDFMKTLVTSPKESIRRLRVLLSFAPRVHGRWGLAPYNLCLFIYNLNGIVSPFSESVAKISTEYNEFDLAIKRIVETTGQLTVLGQLLRIGSCQKSRYNNILYYNIKDDTLWLLHTTVHIIFSREKVLITLDLSKGNMLLSNHIIMTETVVAISLLRAVATNVLDDTGYIFDYISCTWKIKSRTNGHETPSLIEKDVIRKKSLDVSTTNESSSLFGVEYRCKFLIDVILSPLSLAVQEIVQSENTNKEPIAEHILPGAMFRLLVSIYFQYEEGICCCRADVRKSTSLFLLPECITHTLVDLKFVSMIFLPSLCEKCTQSSLLLENTNSQENKRNNLIQLVKIIVCKSSMYFKKSPLLIDSDVKISSDSIFTDNYLNSTGNFEDLSQNQMLNTPKTAIRYTLVSCDQTQLSILLVILNLLVALLKLGKRKRCDEDEEDLQSIIPSLTFLTSLGDMSSQLLEIEGDILLDQTKAEIAEIASDAVVLISTRGNNFDLEYIQNVPNNPEKDGKSHIDLVRERIHQYEEVLLSDQPPMRAMALVKLRDILRLSLDSTFSRDYVPKTNSNPFFPMKIENRIQVIGGENADEHTIACSSNTYLYLIETLLLVTLKPLEDSESYVFLAAIHTIVAIADACPYHVVPLLGLAVSTGRFEFHHLNKTKEPLYMSSMQRIKITESIIFIIRRRGKAINCYAHLLMNMMLFGNQVVPKDDIVNFKCNKMSQYQMMQVQTESYIRFGKFTECTDSFNDEINEQFTRAKNGGPVFDKEEKDILRAIYISISSELLAVMHPSSAVAYCPTLLRLSKCALCLDPARSVRRAAALLCREIYSCALREVRVAFNDENDINWKNASFLTALVALGEDTLRLTLKNCITGNDVDLLGKPYGRKVRGKVRLYDPATVARCREALEICNLLEEMGLFDLVSLLFKTRMKEKHDKCYPKILREVDLEKQYCVNIWRKK